MTARLQAALRKRPPWQRTLIIMFFSQLTSAVGFSLIFPFLPLYVEELSAGAGLGVEFWSGMVVSAQAFTMMIAAPVWGALSDRHGRKMMVQRATFGGAVIIGLMGFVTSAEQLVLLRAIQGLVTGTVSAANALVAAVTPRQHTGVAMGTLQMGLWTGVAVGPLIGGFLSDAFGYQITFVITGALLFIAGVTVTFGVKEQFASKQAAARRTSIIGGWRHVFATPGVSATFSARFLSGLSRAMLIPFIPLLVALLMPSEDLVNTVTGLIVGVASGAATFTAVYLGRLGDRVGHRRIFIGSALILAFALLPQSLVTDTWQLLVLRILDGAASGGIVASLSALLAEYSTPGEEGAVYGLDNASVAASRAVAPLIGSAVALLIGLRGTFVAAGLISLATALLALRLIPEPGRLARSEAGAPTPALLEREEGSAGGPGLGVKQCGK
ncbi:MAG: MFS transporter [Anaerolineae bacterium]